MIVLLYLLVFLSGAAALIYEVAWVRSLSLVFGGSHLAVTTVLSVFMAGLALGSWLIGRRVDRRTRLLRLYGQLELGIAVSAVAFIILLKLYPLAYVPLARLAMDSALYQSTLRIVFALLAMIVPTTLMGGTLPVLARFAARRSGALGRQLSFLYGFNTLGAVTGTLAAGFVLLGTFGVRTTLAIAVGTNLAIGLAAVLIPEPAPLRPDAGRGAAGDGAPRPNEAPGTQTPPPLQRAAVQEAADRERAGPGPGPPAGAGRIVLWGIGASGFCALGYEVLWTRILSMVVGTSVYSFTIMLVAFLTGIALGSAAYGMVDRLVGREETSPSAPVVLFGSVQMGIGLAALAVTVFLRDLPTQAIRLQNLLLRSELSEFELRQWASFALAFGYMLVPALLMGFALPLAGAILAGGRREQAGAVVGRVLAYNTVGAILGASVSGFILIYLFGIERALQLLVVVNLGIGLWVVAVSIVGSRPMRWAAPAAAAAALLALAAAGESLRLWDRNYFAIYRNTQRGAFNTPEKIRDALENTDVLYYFEGTGETISVIKPRGAPQGFIVNGRVEASTTRWDVQCQRTLGHMPMLLHPEPKDVFVLGLGTGMTLGSTSVHPGVRSLTLAELEPGVLPAARTFAAFNHRVLDDPRLKIVFNDGRSFLNTTLDQFDVITADPIHPWSGGAAYLYTAEYFDTVARRLRPGGIACQWLPIYELTAEDVATVVRTFTRSFKHSMLWLTYYDAQLVGSNDPIRIDEAALERRIAHDRVREDLEAVEMGSAADFLSHFVMGTPGLRSFGLGGIVNTDDNLWLEFSAPRSMGVASLMGWNVLALGKHRESLAPYLAQPREADLRAERERFWESRRDAGRVYDRVHALMLWGLHEDPEFEALMARLESEYPGYSPARFLRQEQRALLAQDPKLFEAVRFQLAMGGGMTGILEISAVTIRISDSRGVVTFVDNRAKEIYGERYLDSDGRDIDAMMAAFAREALDLLEGAYADEKSRAAEAGISPPPADSALRRFRQVIAEATAR